MTPDTGVSSLRSTCFGSALRVANRKNDRFGSARSVADRKNDGFASDELRASVKAVLLDKPGPIEASTLRVADIDVPRPGLGQLLMKVEACGVCRSNLHMIEGEWVAFGVPGKLPIVPGHEVVGTVAALGDGVSQFTVGQRVGVQPLWSTCLWCDYCLTAREQLCLSKETTGETLDGGYAEFMLATAAHTYPVPDELSSVDAAPLFCPGITAYSAVSWARLAPGKTVAVFGLGGVGHMVVQFASLAGADVIAIARSHMHLELAAELGASRTIDISNADAGDILAREGGVDAAILFAPSTALARQAVHAVKRGGIVVLGVNADLGEFTFFDNKTIVGSVIGNREQMREVLRLAAAGKVRAVSEAFPLEDAAEVLRRMKRGEIRARAVLTLPR
jgi:propanol-preferring alcohol dehydrogenase